MPKQSYKWLSLLALALGLTLAGGAYAQNTGAGFYLGAGIGKTKFDVDTTPLGLTQVSEEDTDTGWNVFGGYQFNTTWGLEAGYYDLGKYEVSGVRGGVRRSSSGELKTWTVAGTATFPIANNFSFFGKLGIHDPSGDVTIAGRTEEISGSTDAYGGVGVRYDFNRNFGLQLEGDYFNGNNPITAFSLAARYKF